MDTNSTCTTTHRLGQLVSLPLVYVPVIRRQHPVRKQTQAAEISDASFTARVSSLAALISSALCVLHGCTVNGTGSSPYSSHTVHLTFPGRWSLAFADVQGRIQVLTSCQTIYAFYGVSIFTKQHWGCQTVAVVLGRVYKSREGYRLVGLVS